MKKNNFLNEFSKLIIILSFIYLCLQINVLIHNLKFWIGYYESYEIIYGIFKEISEILYIPLWGITLSFSMLFCNYWIKDRKKM